jgi:hypothetical protein
MGHLENLTTKHIDEFTSEDTVYITISEGQGMSATFLCQFISYEKGRIAGKVIKANVNESVYAHKIEKGWEISAKAEKCSLYGKLPHENSSHFHHFKLGRFAKESNKIGDHEYMHVKEHESYGLVSISRYTSNAAQPMFGSSIKHSSGIEFTLKTAEHDRHINNDWYHGKDTIVKFVMSESQFAQLITNPNRGDGAPCTLVQIPVGGELKKMSPPPFISKTEKFKSEFKNKMNNIDQDVKGIMEDAVEILQNKKSINKGDREMLLDAFRMLSQNIKSNVPYIASQFSEQMDKTVSEAKTEIEAFISNKLQNLGLDAAKSDIAKFMLGSGEQED